MDQYLIAFGSNEEDRISHIKKAESLIKERLGRILLSSSYYETSPIGAADKAFINGAWIVELVTKQLPHEVLKSLLEIEKDLGRVRRTRWGNRCIDLDIIAWRESNGSFPKLQAGELEIPHPRCLERDFVLVPIVEIAGDWLHAPSSSSFSEHLEKDLHQKTIQKKIGPS